MRGNPRGFLAGSTSNVDDRRGSLSGRFHKRWWSGFRPAPAWEWQATLAAVSLSEPLLHKFVGPSDGGALLSMQTIVLVTWGRAFLVLILQRRDTAIGHSLTRAGALFRDDRHRRP
jgi:hypothetical protein